MNAIFPPVVLAKDRLPSELLKYNSPINRPWTISLEHMAEYFCKELAKPSEDASDEAYRQCELQEFEHRLLKFIGFYNLKMVAEYLAFCVKWKRFSDVEADNIYRSYVHTAHSERGSAMHQKLD